MNIFKFFERDKDITFYDECDYIFMTSKELIKIIYSNITGTKYL